MSEANRISVVLATYNGADFLGGQLRSFTSQTSLPDEVIVCDDCSDDDTLEILEDFAKSAPIAVTIHRNESRTGPGRTFERAIRSCSGDLIVLSDQDDVWLPNKLERIDQAFQETSALVVIHDLMLVDQSLRPTGVTQLGRMKQLRIPTAQHVTGSATAFRSEMMPMLLPFPPVLRTYDSWIHAVGSALGARLVIPDVLSLYRRHASTETKAVTASWNLKGLVDAVLRLLTKPSDVIDGERLSWLEELERRVTEMSEEGPASISRTQIESAETFILDQRRATESRREVILTPWPRRWARVARAYRKGLYQGFAGPGSAVRDLFTRRGAVVANEGGDSIDIEGGSHA